MIHIAILKPGYIRAILDGRKTIESRLTKTNQPPHGVIKPGERLFLKASGGAFMATAIAGKVRSWADMTPADVRAIRATYGKSIGGDKAYWQAKRDARFATLVTLKDVEPIDVGPAYKIAYMKAWYVLDDHLGPLADYVLTAGAIRNRYASIPWKSKALSGQPLWITLPDGTIIKTELASGRRLRWRGWADLYRNANAQTGDRLRYVRTAAGHYQVRLIHIGHG